MIIKGIGGVFWRTNNLEEIKQWYSRVLNLEIENWNGAIISPQSDNKTIFSFFSESDSYFPTEQQVMLNFQVENIEDSIKHLEKMKIPIVMEKMTNEYGKFIWIEDPEGRRIELWET